MMLNALNQLAQHLQRRKEGGLKAYHLLLTRHSDLNNNLNGCQALAHLMRDGYFSTVLTTNKEQTLAEALEDLGLKPPQLNILRVGQDSDMKDIVAALEDLFLPDSCIIELPSAELPLVIQSSLREYLNEDIVVVGSIEQEKDIVDALALDREGSIYYVLPDKPASDDTIIKILSQQGKPPDTFLISVSGDEFRKFFKSLTSILIPGNQAETATSTQMSKLDRKPIGLTSSRRRQLEQRRTMLQQERDLLAERVKRVRSSWIIEMNPALKYQYEQQIQEDERSLAQLNKELDDIEQLLNQE